MFRAAEKLTQKRQKLSCHFCRRSVIRKKQVKIRAEKEMLGTRYRHRQAIKNRKLANQVKVKDRSQPISRVLSRTAIHLGHPSPNASSSQPGNGAGHTMVPLFGLAPSGVCPAASVTTRAVRSYRTISPLPACVAADIGGVFSVALSVDSRPPGVTWHSALRSPDFPPRTLRLRALPSFRRNAGSRKVRGDCLANSCNHCIKFAHPASVPISAPARARKAGSSNRPSAVRPKSLLLSGATTPAKS